MPICPQCNSTISDSDLFCRQCGHRLRTLEEGRARLGRTLVCIAIGVILGLHFFSLLIQLTASSITSTAPIKWSRELFTISSEVALLFLMFRGHTWARWLVALLSIAASGLALIYAVQLQDIHLGTVTLIFTGLANAAAAGILLLSPAVRAFQNSQREHRQARARPRPNSAA